MSFQTSKKIMVSCNSSFKNYIDCPPKLFKYRPSQILSLPDLINVSYLNNIFNINNSPIYDYQNFHLNNNDMENLENIKLQLLDKKWKSRIWFKTKK